MHEGDSLPAGGAHAHSSRGQCAKISTGSLQVAVVLGTQWGDEGKGKLVDILAQQYDIVARAQVPDLASVHVHTVARLQSLGSDAADGTPPSVPPSQHRRTRA